MPVMKSSSDAGGAFLTQKGEKLTDVKKEIAELEQLLVASAQTSQSTQLLKKRKEMKEVDSALELMKSDYKRRMDECEERRIAFENKQAKMRDQVLKFEKFIQENDAKRLRAENKAKGERKQYMEKLDEVAALTESINKLEKEQKQFSALLDLRARYKEYLEQVVESSDMAYEEINDVLNRYTVLTGANKDLAESAKEQEKEADEYTKKVQALRQESQNLELTSNSLLNDKQKELEVRIEQGKEIGFNINRMMDQKMNVQQEYGAVETAVKNIFSRCVTTMRNSPLFPPGANATFLEVVKYQLDVIHTRLEDLIHISDGFKAGGATIQDASAVLDGGQSQSTHASGGKSKGGDLTGASIASLGAPSTVK
jgi:chromosome segregation ATPase